MEPCPSFRPWHGKLLGRSMLKSTEGKCLHYSFYFLDPEFGLCYLRVPTWAPFSRQFYFNGHNWLASIFTRANCDNSDARPSRRTAPRRGLRKRPRFVIGSVI